MGNSQKNGPRRKSNYFVQIGKEILKQPSSEKDSWVSQEDFFWLIREIAFFEPMEKLEEGNSCRGRYSHLLER